MTLSREDTPLRQGWIILAVLVVVGIAVAVGVIAGISGTRAVTVDPVNKALDTITQSIDLFQIEYAKVRSGAVASQTGAPGAIQTARRTLIENRVQLESINFESVQTLDRELADLEESLGTRPSPENSEAFQTVSAALKQLRKKLKS